MEYQYRVATATVGTKELDNAAANLLNRFVMRGFAVDKVNLVPNPQDRKTLVAHYLLIPIAAEHIAYHIGQVDRKLAALTEAVKQLTSSPQTSQPASHPAE